MTELAFCGFETADGRPVVSYETIEALRRENSDLDFIAQPGGQENALRSEADITITGGNRGGGKALADSEPVCTPFGFRKISDLKPGDIITSANGGMCRVVYVYEQGEQDVYRISFSDGTHVDCTLDHLWNIKRTGYNHKSRWLNETRIEDEWRVWTTGMIEDFLKKRESGKCRRSHLLVPLCGPVKFTRSFNNQYKPATSPYVIGALLGDGCFTESVTRGTKAASFVTDDDFIRQEFENAGIDMSRMYPKKGSAAVDYNIYNDSLKSDIKGL